MKSAGAEPAPLESVERADDRAEPQERSRHLELVRESSPEWLTLKEAAQAVGRKYTTLYRWAKDGKVRSVGSRPTRVELGEVTAYAERHERRARQAVELCFDENKTYAEAAQELGLKSPASVQKYLAQLGLRRPRGPRSAVASGASSPRSRPLVGPGSGLRERPSAGLRSFAWERALLTRDEVAAQIGCHPGTVTKLAKSLEDEGLAMRYPGPWSGSGKPWLYRPAALARIPGLFDERARAGRERTTEGLRVWWAARRARGDRSGTVRRRGIVKNCPECGRERYFHPSSTRSGLCRTCRFRHELKQHKGPAAALVATLPGWARRIAKLRRTRSPGRRRTYTSQQAAWVIALAEKGYGHDRIAQTVGLPRDTVRRIRDPHKRS